jgi:Ni,Fe-hydrogenase III small subunit
MLKNSMSTKKILRRQNHLAIYHQVSPASLINVSLCNCQRALVDESEMIRNPMGTRNVPEMVAVHVSPCAPTPITVINSNNKKQRKS